ncbi:hypothetical protein PGTUg99_015099, partial [Puccinia graminis f. sp. tritici]
GSDPDPANPEESGQPADRFRVWYWSLEIRHLVGCYKPPDLGVFDGESPDTPRTGARDEPSPNLWGDQLSQLGAGEGERVYTAQYSWKIAEYLEPLEVNDRVIRGHQRVTELVDLVIGRLMKPIKDARAALQLRSKKSMGQLVWAVRVISLKGQPHPARGLKQKLIQLFGAFCTANVIISDSHIWHYIR